MIAYWTNEKSDAQIVIHNLWYVRSQIETLNIENTEIYLRIFWIVDILDTTIDDQQWCKQNSVKQSDLKFKF